MLANCLSLLRIGLVPFVLISLHGDGGDPSWTSIALILAAAATDLLDGLAARRFDQASRIGRVLDPVADKIFVASLGLALVFWRSFPWWLLAAQLARDAAILTAGVYLFRTRDTVPGASRLGKYATFGMVLTMIGYAFSLPAVVRTILVAAAAVLLFLSSLDYGRTLLRIRRQESQKEKEE